MRALPSLGGGRRSGRATSSPAVTRRTTGPRSSSTSGRLDEAAELFDGALRTYRRGKVPDRRGARRDQPRPPCRASRDASTRRARAARRRRERLRRSGQESFLIEADARRAQAFVLEGRHDEARRSGDRGARRGCAATGEVGVRTALLERAARARGRAGTTSRRCSPALRREPAGRARARSRLRDRAHAAARVATGLALDGEAEEADAIMERLGVVAIPDVPLP